MSSSVLMVLFLIHFFQTCVANCPPSPSACGIIRNISSPFRLNHDHNHCADRPFELVCENNVTSFYLHSHKYYVKAISYDNETIRLVDASINNEDTCSFPNPSLYPHNFRYDLHIHHLYLYISDTRPINFMSCPYQLKNSSLFTDITHDCASINSSHPRFTYIKVGHMKASEVPESCRVELAVMTSWEFNGSNSNVSLSEIHHSLLYGFQLYFSQEHKASKWEKFRDFLFGLLWILVPIVGLLCALVSPPVMTIIGVTAVAGLSYLVLRGFFNIIHQSFFISVPLQVIEIVIGALS